MKQTLLVAWQELIVNLRRPGFIIMTLIVPVLGLVGVLVGSLFGGQVGQFLEKQFAPGLKATGYVDLSGLLTAGSGNYAGKYIPYADESSARADLLAKKVDSYFVVPADYLDTGSVVVYSTKGGFSAFTAIEDGDMGRFLVDQLLAGKVDPKVQNRVANPVNPQPVSLNDKGEVSTASPFSWLGDFVLPYLFAILFVVTIFTTSGFLLQGVSEEKEGRIIEILVSSISPTQLLAGKILGLGALGLIQVLFWVGTGVGLVAMAVETFALGGVIKLSLATVALGIVYYVLGYLLYATLMAVAGSLGTTQRESQQIASIFSVAAAIPWMIIGVIFSNPNATIAVVLSYIPLTSPVMMFLRLGFGSVPAWQTAISLVLLVVGIAFSLWAGAKMFRLGLLMYGKRPSLRELARSFKQA